MENTATTTATFNTELQTWDVRFRGEFVTDANTLAEAAEAVVETCADQGYCPDCNAEGVETETIVPDDGPYRGQQICPVNECRWVR